MASLAGSTDSHAESNYSDSHAEVVSGIKEWNETRKEIKSLKAKLKQLKAKQSAGYGNCAKIAKALVMHNPKPIVITLHQWEQLEDTNIVNPLEENPLEENPLVFTCPLQFDAESTGRHEPFRLSYPKYMYFPGSAVWKSIPGFCFESGEEKGDEDNYNAFFKFIEGSEFLVSEDDLIEYGNSCEIDIIEDGDGHRGTISATFLKLVPRVRS